jgi:hypothetical protein
MSVPLVPTVAPAPMPGPIPDPHLSRPKALVLFCLCATALLVIAWLAAASLGSRVSSVVHGAATAGADTTATQTKGHLRGWGLPVFAVPHHGPAPGSRLWILSALSAGGSLFLASTASRFRRTNQSGHRCAPVPTNGRALSKNGV